MTNEHEKEIKGHNNVEDKEIEPNNDSESNRQDNKINFEKFLTTANLAALETALQDKKIKIAENDDDETELTEDEIRQLTGTVLYKKFSNPSQSLENIYKVLLSKSIWDIENQESDPLKADEKNDEQENFEQKLEPILYYGIDTPFSGNLRPFNKLKATIKDLVKKIPERKIL